MRIVCYSYQKNLCSALEARRRTLGALHSKFVGQGMNAKTEFERQAAFHDAEEVERKLNKVIELQKQHCQHVSDNLDVACSPDAFFGDEKACRVYDL